MTAAPPLDPHLRFHRAAAEAADELLALHRALVRIPSVNAGDGSSARERLVAAEMDRYLAEARVERRVAESAPERANFLAALRPRSSRDDAPPGPTLLMISHSDVVPTGDESAWRFPPFSAEVAEGRVWGRGANDCKMLVAAELFVLRTIARLDLPLAGELRVAVGADEEAGGALGFGWLAKNEPDFLRADLGLNEGGGATLGRAADGAWLALVGAGEKGRYEVRFVARGPGAHASTPWGRANPVLALAELARRIDAWDHPAAPVSPVFLHLREWLGLPGPIDAANLDATIRTARERFSVSFFNSLMAQSRATIAPTWIAGGDKTNALPARTELRCDARILPGSSRADLERVLADLTSDLAVEIELVETAAPSVSAFDAAVAGRFENALARTLNDGALDPSAPGEVRVAVAPTWCTGFTDSRFVRSLGTPMYGFQFVEPAADPDRLSIHCIDESIEVGMLLPCALALGHFAIDFLGLREARPS